MRSNNYRSKLITAWLTSLSLTTGVAIALPTASASTDNSWGRQIYFTTMDASSRHLLEHSTDAADSGADFIKNVTSPNVHYIKYPAAGKVTLYPVYMDGNAPRDISKIKKGNEADTCYFHYKYDQSKLESTENSDDMALIDASYGRYQYLINYRSGLGIELDTSTCVMHVDLSKYTGEIGKKFEFDISAHPSDTIADYVKKETIYIVDKPMSEIPSFAPHYDVSSKGLVVDPDTTIFGFLKVPDTNKGKVTLSQSTHGYPFGADNPFYYYVYDQPGNLLCYKPSPSSFNEFSCIYDSSAPLGKQSDSDYRTIYADNSVRRSIMNVYKPSYADYYETWYGDALNKKPSPSAFLPGKNFTISAPYTDITIVDDYDDDFPSRNEVILPSLATTRGVTISRDSSTPSWANISENGAISGRLPQDLNRTGKTIKYPIKVVANYKDHSRKVITAFVNVASFTEAAQYSPTYPTNVVVQSQRFGIPPDKSTYPKGTKFSALGSKTFSWVNVHPDGSITGTVPSGERPRDTYFRVLATYPDKSSEEVRINLKIIARPQSEVYSPRYRIMNVTPTKKFFIPQPVDVPSGTKFSALGSKTFSWANVHSDGSVTGTVPSGEKPRNTYFRVLATYPDKTTEEVRVDLVIRPRPQNEVYHPSYGGFSTLVPGHSFTIPRPDSSTFPSGTRFSAGTGSAMPSWVKVASDGTLTGTVPTSQRSDSIALPIRVTYPDNSSELIAKNIKIARRPQNEANNPSYGNSVFNTTQGYFILIASPAGMPRGSHAEKTKGTPSWMTVKPDGSITGTVPVDQRVGTMDVPVSIVYADGTKDTIVKRVNIMKRSDASVYSPSYGSGKSEVMQGRVFTVTSPIGAPSGTRFVPKPDTPSWVKVSSDGSIRGVVPASEPVGNKIVSIDVIYPDGTRETIPKSLNVVAMPLADAYTPEYSDSPMKVEPNKKFSMLGPVSILPGTTFSASDVTPPWVHVHSDGYLSGVVPDGYNKNYVIPIAVAYRDGSSETVYVTLNTDAPRIADKEKYQPSYSATPLQILQGGSAITKPLASLPPHAVVRRAKTTPSWVTSIASNGVLSIVIPRDYKVGMSSVDVEVSYPDGSSEIVTRKINVTKMADADFYTPKFIASSSNPRPGESIKVAAPTDVPVGTRVERLPDTFPGVSIDTKGNINISVPNDADPGQKAIPVKVVYPDGSFETAYIFVTVGDRTDNQKYDVAFVLPKTPIRPGKPVTIYPRKRLPSGARMVSVQGTPDWVHVDAEGPVTVKTTFKVPSGKKIIPVDVVYADGSKDHIRLSVDIDNTTDSQTYATQYPTDSQVYKPGTSLNGSIKPQDVPSGASFVSVPETPKWVVVNPDGSISGSIPATVEGSSAVLIPVKVIYPDGSSKVITRVINIEAKHDVPSISDIEKNKPVYDASVTVVTNPQGKLDSYQAIIPQPSHFLDSYIAKSTSATPPWATVNNDGSIVVNVAKDEAEGVKTIPVVISDTQGHSVSVVAKIFVEHSSFTPDTPTESTLPVYDVTDDKPVVISIPEEAEYTIAAPHGVTPGTSFAPAVTTPLWVSVKEDGSLVISPGSDVANGRYDIPVEVHLPDGSVKVISVPIVIDHPVIADPTTPSFKYPSTSDKPEVISGESGSTHTSPAPVDVPTGATFAPTEDTPSWAKVNPDGSVTVTVTDDVVDGVQAIPVMIHLADGTTKVIYTYVVVHKVNTSVQSLSDQYDPQWDIAKVVPGSSKVISLKTAVPHAIFTQTGDQVLSWVTVASDGMVKVDPPADVKQGRYRVKIAVKYDDGSFDESEFIVDVADVVLDPPGSQNNTSSSDTDSIVPIIAGVGVLVGVIAVVARLVTALPAGVPVADVGLILPNGTVIGGRYNSRRVNELDDHARYSGPFVY